MKSIDPQISSRKKERLPARYKKKGILEEKGDRER